MTTLPELESFLRELATLSARTGFWIDGCGDCGSPWISSKDADRDVATNLGPTDERDGYRADVPDKWKGESVTIRATDL